jgi:DNA invertase Pin-like site-specific DNA recombinase
MKGKSEAGTTDLCRKVAVGYLLAIAKGDPDSLRRQRDEVVAYANNIGVQLAQVFADDSTHDEPCIRALKEAVAYCEEREIDCLIVASDNIAARNPRAYNCLVEALTTAGTRVLIAPDPRHAGLDDSSVDDLIGSLRESQHSHLSDATRSGMLKAKRLGRLIHRPPVGYMCIPMAQVIPNPETAHNVMYAFELFAHEKRSFKEIAAILAEMGLRNTSTGRPYTLATIRRMLTNPIYKGYLPIDGGAGYARSEFAPIVEEGLFEAVQERLRTASRSSAGASKRKRDSSSNPKQTPSVCSGR